MKVFICVEAEVTPAPVTARKSTRGIQVVDFNSQVLPTAASSSSDTSRVVLPPAVDFTAQALTTGSSASSSASTLSATVKRDVDFASQVLPGEQASLVQKTESLAVGIARTSTGKSQEADMTRRTAELVACICIHCPGLSRYTMSCIMHNLHVKC